MSGDGEGFNCTVAGRGLVIQWAAFVLRLDISMERSYATCTCESRIDLRPIVRERSLAKVHSCQVLPHNVQKIAG